MRLYNGCPDKELQGVIDDRQRAYKEIDKLGLRATWFPMEEKWMVFNKDNLAVSGFCSTIQEAANQVRGLK